MRSQLSKTVAVAAFLAALAALFVALFATGVRPAQAGAAEVASAMARAQPHPVARGIERRTDAAHRARSGRRARVRSRAPHRQARSLVAPPPLLDLTLPVLVAMSVASTAPRVLSDQSVFSAYDARGPPRA